MSYLHILEWRAQFVVERAVLCVERIAPDVELPTVHRHHARTKEGTIPSDDMSLPCSRNVRAYETLLFIRRRTSSLYTQ